ncbi:DarT ssDNA thymidine ADP-ribosyltransferase family protein [Lacrimispora sp. 38-1]|uniref:DarT ssDNA thymidine ADP-ribosyltransferase family protein n=1 Tax=Lacrimispora sp. 38-1 TaxID=3125778 RepID=UPI003CF4373B
MSDKEKIINEINLREIEYFVHFTDVNNLPNILKMGLLTRSTLDLSKMKYSYNDEVRADNVTKSISLSISFPNYKMFYPITLKYPNREYCVLLLKALEVIKYDCAFNFTNAASNACRFIPIEERKTYSSFHNMFQLNLNGHIRSELCLFDFEPTDPQAEILVLDNIPAKCIELAFFRTQYNYQQYKNIFMNSSIRCWFDQGYFYPRHDFQSWR